MAPCLLALVLAAAPLLAAALDISQCIAPLGMESGQIPDRDLSASSSFNDGNVGPQNGRLNQELAGGAWCPKAQVTTETSEWLQVELGAVHVVTAVGTQGRFGNGQGQEFAEAYVLEYWRPRLGKWLRYRSADGQEILTGNTNTYLEQKNRLEPPVWASRLRLLPYSSHRRTVCMRVELYGCYWAVGIVSYSMPKGNKRSNGAELTDATYDGAWGAELRGGLGQLVDGRFGGDDIREAARPSAWVGWRNDSRAPPAVTFEFDRVREFSALHIYCNNRFMRDVQVFSEAVISFSVGGQQFQEDPIRHAVEPDHIFESSRNVTIKLHHRIGRWVRVELHFAARWILVSEFVFDSDVAQGNYSAERLKPLGGGAGAGGAGAGGGGGGAGAGGGKEAPVSTAAQEDPLYMAIVVGVLTALVILLAVAVLLVVHRHRHRKCLASPLGKATSGATVGPGVGLGMSLGGSMGGGGEYPGRCELAKPPLDKPDEYQEPYQPLCARYCSYSAALLEMKEFARDSTGALSDSSNYEYAVPELSSAPLLSRGAGGAEADTLPLPPPRAPDAYARSLSHSPHSAHSAHSAHSLHSRSPHSASSLSTQSVVSELRRRLQTTSVAEFPRHRLRMISKLAEGAFGTVYVAEADGVPEYDGSVTAEKRLVAVKFLCHDASPAEREEFERDVRILAALSCPQLARVVGACRAPPLAVVLEYLTPGDLCAWLRAAAAQPPAPPAHALLHIAVQVAAGMRYLESLNFVHRDLAARNILIGKGYQVKISDFGTDNEAYARDYYRAGGRPLPLRWAAWEALAGRHSTRSDVWAFAVTLHEILTLCQRRPYEHLTDEQVLENLSHLQADDGRFECVARAGGVPRDLYDAMRACWRRDAPARPSFADLHALLLRRAAAAAAPT